MLSSSDLVARIRVANGDTQEALARRLGVSYPTINAWERGRSEPMPRHRRTLEGLATELQIVHSLVVLVIDSDPATARLAQTVASQLDDAVSVESATDAWEGLVKCGALKPRLLIVDALLPGLDGFELARRLPLVDGLDDLRVVFVAPSLRPELLAQADELGSRVLTKPLSALELATAMRDVVGKALVH